MANVNAPSVDLPIEAVQREPRGWRDLVGDQICWLGDGLPGLERKRLERLVVMLGRVKSKRFNMAFWAQAPAEKDVGECGTVACAAGWAAADHSLRRQGFSLVKKDPSWRTPEGHVQYHPAFGRTRGGSAVQRFFGLTSEELQRLFTVDGYWHLKWPIKPCHVITQVNRLLRADAAGKRTGE